jgi:DNA-binding NarL/FixJ family response regulator
MPMDSIRLMMVEDHPAARTALVGLLREEPDLTIVGQAANGKEALQQLLPTEPEVILMDVRMPVLDGVATTQIIHSEFPQVCVVGMSVGPDDPEATAMCQAGAVTCVPRGDAPGMLAAIRQCRDRRPAA